MSQLGLNNEEQMPVRANAGGYKTSKLGSCPDCGKEISKQAAACPNCGLPLQNQKTVTASRAGWVGTIAFGVFFGGVLTAIVSIVLTFLLFIFFGALIAGGGHR